MGQKPKPKAMNVEAGQVHGRGVERGEYPECILHMNETVKEYMRENGEMQVT